jgi:CrcB protein
MLGVGFCGSFTTFSTYSVDVAGWIAQGQTMNALKYVLANNVGGIMAAAAGMALTRKLLKLKKS